MSRPQARLELRGVPARSLPVRCKSVVRKQVTLYRSLIAWFTGIDVLLIALVPGLLLGALARGETACLPRALAGLLPVGGLLLLPLHVAIRIRRARRQLAALNEARQFGPLPPLRGSKRWITDRGIYDDRGDLSPWRGFSAYHLDHLVPEGHRLILWYAERNRWRDAGQAAIISVLFLLSALLEGQSWSACVTAHGVTNDTLITGALGVLCLLQIPLVIALCLLWARSSPEDTLPFVLLVNSETVSRDELELLLLGGPPRRAGLPAHADGATADTPMSGMASDEPAPTTPEDRAP